MYYGKKRLQYTRIFGQGRESRVRDRWAEFRDGYEERWQKTGPPKDIVGAIIQWIDESMSPLIKNAINFSNQTRRSINLRTNQDYISTDRYGNIMFLEDRVKISCGGPFRSEWEIEILYADPSLFDYIEAALRRFYNGT